MTIVSHLVIDISVAKSVGDPPRHPTAVACSEFVRLIEDKACPTGALMTPAIRVEWKKHASPLMTSWLVSMVNKGRVRLERDRRVNDLRSAVEEVDDKGIRLALEKDIHMSEAAILHGVPVVSRDDKQRRYLAIVGASYTAAARIQWFNPVSHDRETWTGFVLSGCTDREMFRTSDGSI